MYLTMNLVVTIFHEPVYSIIDWKSKESHVFALTALLTTLLNFCCARIIYEVFKKKKVERTHTIDDFFFSDKPFEIAAIHKLLERKYVWYTLVTVIAFLTLSTITDFYFEQ